MTGDKYQYNAQSRTLKQVIEKPDSFDYLNEPHKLENYYWGEKNLPSYPAEALGNLPDKKILVEDVDFRFMDTNKWYWCKCEKCGWEGKKPATMGAAGLKIKVCQNCLSSSIAKK